MNLKKFLLSLLVFFSIYTPYIQVGGVNIPFPYMFILVVMFFFLLKVTINKSLDRIFYQLIVSFFIVLMWFLTTSLVNEYFDQEFFLIIALGILNICCASFIASQLVRDFSFFEFFKVIYLCIFVHALIMVLTFFSETFSNFLYSIIVLGDTGKHFIEMGIRSPGLTGGGGDHLSVVQAFGLLFGYQYFLSQKHSPSTIIFIILTFMVLLLSIFLSARSGLVFFIIGFFYLSFYEIFYKNKDRISCVLNFNAIKKLFLVSLIISLGILVSFILLRDSEYIRFFNRSFEFVLTYMENGEFRTNSTDAMSSMYFLPDTSKQLLFGNGDYGRNETIHFLNSDIGFVRIIFGGGGLGVIMLLFPLFIMAYNVYQSSDYSEGREARRMILLMLILIVLFNFKVVHLYGSRETFSVLYLMFFFYIFKSKESK